MEARLCAEDPENGFLPSPGLVGALELPEDVRVDSGVEAGDSVTPFYDSMIAKLIAHDVSREAAFDRLRDALSRTVVIGPKTNLAFLSALIASPKVRAGAHDTGFIDAHLSELGASPREPERAATLAAADAFWRERAAGQGVASLDPWDIRRLVRAFADEARPRSKSKSTAMSKNSSSRPRAARRR